MEDTYHHKHRTTSAGYRFPIAARPRSSEFHQNCIPADKRPRPPAESTTQKSGSHSEGDYKNCDVVTQDKIWKQSVNKEVNTTKEWKDNWGFLTEFDSKGEPIEPEELPEKVNMYSDVVPDTNSGNYGHRLKSDIGQQMQSLEFQFNATNRRRKMGSDLVCY